MKNYYEILEVNKKASKEVIEKAYKVLVKKYHPDRNQIQAQNNSEQKMKEINEAYEILSNDFLREQYNLELEKEEEKKSKSKLKEGQEEAEELNRKMKTHKIGSFSGIIELLKQLYKDKSKRQEIKEVTRKDVIAIILTIIIVILIGIALWYIPFTNGWMRELLFENPLFNWIGKLFSK